MPLANAEEQPEHIRQLLTRPDTLNVLRLLANAPNVFDGWAQMAGQLFDSPTFTARMREVIILRVAHLQDSPYELAQHVSFARTAGLTDQQIDALQQQANLDAAGFSGDERTVIDTVTELCTTRRLSDDSFATAQALARRRGAHRIADDRQLLLRPGAGAQRRRPRDRPRLTNDSHPLPPARRHDRTGPRIDRASEAISTSTAHWPTPRRCSPAGCMAGDAALTSPVLSSRLRELVVLRTAYLMDCAYELGQHRDVAHTVGVDADDIDAITSESDWQTGHFDPTELAVLRLTTELVTTRHVAATLFDQVHTALGLGGHRRSADGDQPVCGPGADAQRARRRPR